MFSVEAGGQTSNFAQIFHDTCVTVFFDPLMGEQRSIEIVSYDDGLTSRVVDTIEMCYFHEASSGLVILKSSATDTLYQLPYSKQRLDGIVKVYETDKLIGLASYVRGERNGMYWTRSIGYVVEVLTYKDDLPHGLYEMRDDLEGRLIQSGLYVNGQKTGLWITWQKNGTVSSALPYDNGQVMDGMYYIFSMTGVPEAEVEYRKGRVIKYSRANGQ